MCESPGIAGWMVRLRIGKFACFQPSGNSVVDYCLIREHYKSVVKKFSVGDLTMHSDHVPLKVELKANYLNRIYPNHEHTNCDNLDRRKNNDQKRDDLKDDYKYRYIIQENSEMKIKKILNSQGLKNELEKLKLNIAQGETSVDDTVKTLRKFILISLTNPLNVSLLPMIGAKEVEVKVMNGLTRNVRK